MIAVVLVIDKKTKQRKTIEFWCAGYSDARQTVKDMRKVTTAKMRLIDLRSK